MLPFDVGDPVRARAAWSRIAEPGDEHAGAVVRELGPSGALDWLCSSAARASGLAPPLRQLVERLAPRLDGLDIRRELEVLQRLGGHLLTPEGEGWPTALDDLSVRAPFALWVRAAAPCPLDLPRGRSLAIVGSRASTRYGETIAAEFAFALAEEGLTVVSGGAYGIDAAAHRGALAARGAPTIALLAGGVDRLYPAGNEALLLQVAQTGALVAEVPPGSVPGRHRFLARNRLIAALTSGTLVVEAARRSGALSTANHASDLLRPVGAVPGPVTSAASSGCHWMIREGQAVCVTTSAEARELAAPAGEFAAPLPGGPPGLLDDLNPVQARVLDALPLRAAAHVPSVARAAGVSEADARSALGLLELAGRVRRRGDGWARVAS